MIKLGDRVEIAREFSRDDVERFFQLSGGSVDLDAVPEPLLAGLISDILGTRLPGHGAMYMKQTTQFQHSATIDETITASAEVTRIRKEKLLVTLKTECRANGRLLSSGEALVMYPGVAQA